MTLEITSGLNTLSGGHPLGGGDARQSDLRWTATSQYPLRRASSWRADDRVDQSGRRSLNTLSGGHPLGGVRIGTCTSATATVSIPSQAGILLAGWHSHRCTATCMTSQYPLRRASSWRGSCARQERRSSRSQYPLRRASSWRSCRQSSARSQDRSQYPLRRASSWRQRTRSRSDRCRLVSIPSQAGILLAVGNHSLSVDASQYPLRRASSWRRRLVDGRMHRTVSIPSQAGILLAGMTQSSTCDLDHVSIPSQAGILLAGSCRRRHRHS